MRKFTNFLKLLAFSLLLTGCSDATPPANLPPDCTHGHTWGTPVAYTENNDCSSISTCMVCGETQITQHSLAHNHQRIRMPDSPYFMYKCDDCGYSYTTYKGASEGHDFFDVSGLHSYVSYSGYKLDTVEDGECDYLAGHNGTQMTIKFTILSSKAGKAHFFIDACASSNSTTKWSSTLPTIQVNSKSYTTTENHHAYNSSRGASSRFYDYYYDYIVEVDITKGKNVITLGSGSNAVDQHNIKAFRFIKDYSMYFSLTTNS